MRSEKGLLLTVIQGNNLPEPEDDDNNTSAKLNFTF